MNFNEKGRKVGLAGDGRYQGREQIFYERGDHRAEGCTYDHANSQIDHVPAKNEIPKSFEHDSSYLPLQY